MFARQVSFVETSSVKLLIDDPNCKVDENWQVNPSQNKAFSHQKKGHLGSVFVCFPGSSHFFAVWISIASGGAANFLNNCLSRDQRPLKRRPIQKWW